jgi:hypothetical protein
MALSSQTLRWQETGGSIEIAAPESAARCIPLCGLVLFPIFRVPEYSELSIVSALGAHEFRSMELVGSEYSALPI